MPRPVVVRLGSAAVFFTVSAAVVAAVAADFRNETLCRRAALAVQLDDRAFDPATGRDPRNFPPDPQVDYKHLKLDLRMDDPFSKSFRCTETLTFQTLGRPISRLDLNAVALQIKSVTDLEGKPLAFRYDDQILTVRFPAELPPKTDGGIKIEYECHNPKNGMFFALADEANKDRATIIHTQGEAEYNRYWFVSHDYPNERFTSETITTVPKKYTVVSNGKLVERKELDGGMVQYHYLMEQPHVSYLVSLVIGDLVRVADEWRGKPVEYYVPPYEKDLAKKTFGKTPKMMELFSKLTGFDYPYAKYAQTIVYEFHWGGMENISATTLWDNTVHDERSLLDSDEEGLISHELAHQWFGDAITCDSWPHLWLNEGFATFMANVWDEHEHGRDAYLHDVWGTMHGVAEGERLDARGGLVWRDYANPDDTFGRGVSNPYSKGSSVIHMLRCELGDELFWKCIQEYFKRYAWQTAETDDFRKVFEDVSGRNLERFFHQWFHRPGAPHVRVGYEWDDGAKEARITLEQTQEISEKSPIFAADVNVWCVYDDGKIEKHVMPMEQRFAKHVIRCPKEPVQVCVDPDSALLAKYEFNLPLPMQLRTMKEGPTMAARLNALYAVRGQDRDEVREALKAVMLDEKTHYGLRNDAAAALGQMQKDAARDILLDALAEGKEIKDHKVRRAAVDALGRYRDAKVVPTLLRLARKDATYSVEVAATSALANQEPSEEIIAVLLANAQKPSWDDQIRTAAIGALERSEDMRGLEPARKLAAAGQPYRHRGTGIRALGNLGRKEKDEAKRTELRKYLESLLKDPQDNAVDAAIDALGALGDDKAIPALQTFAAGSGPADERQRARGAIDAINRKTGETAVITELRGRVEKLEKVRDDLEKRLLTLEKSEKSGH